MGEKTKNVIVDMLKSDEMKAYFRELLNEQTSEIVSSIESTEKKKENEEILLLKKEIEKYRQEHEEFKQKLSESELIRLNLESNLDGKETEINKLSACLRKIEEENAELKSNNEQLASDLLDEKAKIKDVKQTLETEILSLSKKLEEYTSFFEDAYGLYTHYNSLPLSLKQRMSNIFVNDNVYSMISVVSNWNCIEGLWGFTKRRIIEDENDGLDELVCLFSKAFELYSVIDGNDRYGLISPCIGEKYDSDKHSIKGIKTDGVIEKVLLDGIYDSISKKTVFKAVVQVM